MTVEVTQGSDRWRRCADEDLLIASCGRDFVAYHRPSGKTHLLNESSHTLITEFLEGNPDLDEIVDRFAAEPGSLDHDDFTAHMAAMLYSLEQLGLVERV